jgi:hypothetical protein
MSAPVRCLKIGSQNRTAKRRSERRSDDGQVILETPSAGRKLEPDLLVCGAPLRNRTVDLLLTIYPRVHAVANWDDAGQVRGGALCCRPTYLFIARHPAAMIDAAPGDSA